MDVTQLLVAACASGASSKARQTAIATRCFMTAMFKTIYSTLSAGIRLVCLHWVSIRAAVQGEQASIKMTWVRHGPVSTQQQQHFIISFRHRLDSEIMQIRSFTAWLFLVDMRMPQLWMWPNFQLIFLGGRVCCQQNR
jgi:hypothetical protein